MCCSPSWARPVAADAYHLDRKRVAAAFDRAAPSYDAHAVLQRTVAERLDERLEVVRMDPEWILDAGAGTGTGARLLRKRYGRARVVLVDFAPCMLRTARSKARKWLSREGYLCADTSALPLPAASVDLVFSSLALQWSGDLEAACTELRRVLKPGGLLMFSTFGPDTLRELRRSWAEVDRHVHVHAFMDMHDIGDALIRAGFSSPVLDVERITLTYPDLHGLMRDLKRIGASNASAGRPPGLTGRRALTRVQAAYEQHRRDGLLPATYEVVYGHGWAPEHDTRPQDGSTVATFPLSRLERRHGGSGRSA